MNKRKGIRFIAALAVCVLMVGSFSMTAFAYADDTEQDLPITEATQPDASQTITPGEPFDDEGNAYTRDLLYDKATNKQFITIQTKNGNTFYIVIDYDAPINEDEEQYQTYFLNMVDEMDLFALLEDDEVAKLTTCTCEDKCVIGDVNTDCPICRTNMSECTGTVPEPVQPSVDPDADADADTEPEPVQPEKSSNLGMIIVVVLVVAAGGGAYYYIKFVRGKKQKDEDLDFFDDEGYEEETYINEDEEPVIADDDEDDILDTEDDEE